MFDNLTESDLDNLTFFCYALTKYYGLQPDLQQVVQDMVDIVVTTKDSDDKKMSLHTLADIFAEQAQSPLG
jgi:hypothetical protein